MGGSLRLARRSEAVADAVVGEDVGGVGRVVAELLSELLDGGADAVGVVRAAPSPHVAQQRLVGHDPSCVAREGAEQVELGGGEGDVAAGGGNAPRPVVDGEFAECERLGIATVP